MNFNTIPKIGEVRDITFGDQELCFEASFSSGYAYSGDSRKSYIFQITLSNKKEYESFISYKVNVNYLCTEISDIRPVLTYTDRNRYHSSGYRNLNSEQVNDILDCVLQSCSTQFSYSSINTSLLDGWMVDSSPFSFNISLPANYDNALIKNATILISSYIWNCRQSSTPVDEEEINRIICKQALELKEKKR